jgi:RimJ/RimL family protein N-acetyltransferase
MLKAKRLEGRSYYLRPVRDADRDAIRDIFSSDPDNWSIQTVSALGEAFERYWSNMLSMPGRITLCVVEVATGEIVGTSSFVSIDELHRTVEIGYTFYLPRVRGTRANPETKWLMLNEAFSAGFIRVQFSVSEANEHSQAAMSKLGAVREGVLRNHRITWTGCRRNTVVFSITDSDWPEVRVRLCVRLEN